MKKGLKLGIVALSLAAMAGTIYTANVNAQNQVKVEITGGANTCANLADYDWGQKEASTSEIPLDLTGHDLVCELLASTGGNITIELSNLSGDNGTIANSNFTVYFGTGYTDGSLTDRAETQSVTFDDTKTFYTKPQYKVGNLTGSVNLSGVIPAGQAIGSYVGELNISVPY